MSKNFDPKKPAWDTSKSGELPEELKEEFAKGSKLAKQQEKEFELFATLSPEERLDRLDAMQAEATQVANSRAAEFATPEQQFINTWQREATVASASLFVFQNPSNQVEERETKIVHCKRTLATALYKLGRIEEALMMATEFPDLTAHIRAVQSAIEKPDEDLQTHSCPREAATQDGKSIELDRHWSTEEVVSAKHGKLVYVWECTQCGTWNATAEKPERQQRNDATMLATIHSLAKGDSPLSKGIAESPKLKQFEAGVVMVKDS